MCRRTGRPVGRAVETGRQEIAACKPEQLREDRTQHPPARHAHGQAQAIANMKAQDSQWEEQGCASALELGCYICIPKAFCTNQVCNIWCTSSCILKRGLCSRPVQTLTGIIGWLYLNPRACPVEKT